MTSDRPQITPHERALIEAHIAKHGVTLCPPGKMATAVDYVFCYTGTNGALRPKDGSNERHKLNNKAFFKNRARAARLRKAEAGR